MKIVYDDSMRTGIEHVDEQHQSLVELYNELDEAVWNGQAHRQMREILARLYKYTKTHFRDEERLMVVTGYPDFAQHQFEHQRLVDRLRRFVVRYQRADERISNEMIDFVRKWITAHIREADMAYVSHVRANWALVVRADGACSAPSAPEDSVVEAPRAPATEEAPAALV